MIIYLAPIMGITDHVYRSVFARYFKGVNLGMAPFISSVRGRKIKANYLKDILPTNNREMKVVPQILSNDAEDFVFLAERVYDLGYESVNWNLGCPSPMVTRKERGSGLLPSPDRINKFLDHIHTHCSCAISVKTRLGFHSPAELKVLMPIFNQYPLTEIIVHPRLGMQLYDGVVDIDSFAECRDLSIHKIIYNGDITDISFFERLRDSFPDINGWMIGRGLLSNPFLAANIKDLDNPCLKTANEMDILKKFHQELYDQYGMVLFGPSHLLGRMKALWKYFSGIFTDPDQVLKKINKIKNTDHYNDYICRLFENEASVAPDRC